MSNVRKACFRLRRVRTQALRISPGCWLPARECYAPGMRRLRDEAAACTARARWRADGRSPQSSRRGSDSTRTSARQIPRCRQPAGRENERIGARNRRCSCRARPEELDGRWCGVSASAIDGLVDHNAVRAYLDGELYARYVSDCCGCRPAFYHDYPMIGSS